MCMVSLVMSCPAEEANTSGACEFPGETTFGRKSLVFFCGRGGSWSRDSRVCGFHHSCGKVVKKARATIARAR